MLLGSATPDHSIQASSRLRDRIEVVLSGQAFASGVKKVAGSTLAAGTNQRREPRINPWPFATSTLRTTSTPQATRQLQNHRHIISERAKPFDSCLHHAPLKVVSALWRRRGNEKVECARWDRLRDYYTIQSRGPRRISLYFASSPTQHKILQHTSPPALVEKQTPRDYSAQAP